MKQSKNVIWGILLVAVGIIWGLDSLEIIDFTLFFDGWWTLFIIIPCLIDLFTEREKTGSIIGLIIGVLLLLSCQGLFSFRLLWKLFIPFVIVVIGIRLIFKNFFNRKAKLTIEKITSAGAVREYNAVFSGQNLNFENEVFEGVKLNCIFGGIKCDLRKAYITKDSVIETNCIFGGADIFLPDNVNVKITSDSIFGGVSCKKPAFKDESLPTVYIKSANIFGGTDIK